MEIEETTAGRPIRVGDITLVPIIRTFVSGAGVEPGVVIHGSRSPTAFVVNFRGGRYALDPTGKRMPIDHYLQQVRGLAELLKTL